VPFEPGDRAREAAFLDNGPEYDQILTACRFIHESNTWVFAEFSS